jgi:hypothetical protein
VFQNFAAVRAGHPRAGRGPGVVHAVLGDVLLGCRSPRDKVFRVRVTTIPTVSSRVAVD